MIIGSNNIYSLFKNYLLCKDIEYVIFPYGFHGERKQIFEQIIGCLREDGILFEVCPIILKCCKEENIKRAIYPNIDSTCLQPEKVAEKIIETLNIRLTGNEG